MGLVSTIDCLIMNLPKDENLCLVLPPEMWYEVLCYVAPKDLCSVTLVSKHMNCMASDPLLWCSMNVNKKRIISDGIEHLFAIPRFSKVKKLNLGATKPTLTQLKHFLNTICFSSAENINKYVDNLQNKSDEYLYDFFKDVDAQGINLSIEQSLQNAVLDEKTTSCDLPNQNISVQLHDYLSSKKPVQEPTTDQLRNLLPSCTTSSSIQDIILRQIDLSTLPPILLSQAFSCLHTLNLCLTNLTTDQISGILATSLLTKTLENIDLERVDLSQVPVNVLAPSLARLKTANISRTHLQSPQIEAILSSSITSNSLTDLNLELIILSSIPFNILTPAITRLCKANLSRTSLLTDQVIHLLNQSSKTLKEINLNHINLSQVPSELLSQSLAQLHTVILNETRLTVQQLTSFLTTSACSNNLQNVSLEYVDVSEVASDILAQAVCHLHKVNLDWTQMTVRQIKSVLTSCVSSTSLVEIKMWGVKHYSQVPLNLRTDAKNKLKVVEPIEDFSDYWGPGS